MKKIKIFILFLFSIFIFEPVYALKPSEITARNVCEKLELAIAKNDGNLENVSCHDNYQEAKDIMNQTDNDDLVIIEAGVIVDAKYAVVDYDIYFPNTHKGYISVYASNTSNTEITYIRTSEHYADDAVLLDVDYQNKRVKIKVAGVTGWIKEYDDTLKLYDIVPLNWMVSPQYYKVTSDTIEHVFPSNVYGERGNISYKIDRKPSMLEVGTYYSYDGNYFYTDFKTMLKDYKNNTFENAINSQNIYYNYYQYLSFRTKTSYSAENINAYINTWTNEGKMLNTGEAFIKAQETYGINAILMMAIGMNESGLGKSPIALEKNNLFGLNAIDSAPGSLADVFLTVEDCINDYAYLWLSYGYSDPEDYRYYGANLGNKASGANVKYASDPFWAEKAAAYYYGLDKSYDFQDYGSVKTAVLNNDYSNMVYAKKGVNGENVASFYQYKVKGSSISILEEVQGPSVNGNTVWYKVMSDPTLDSNLNYITYSKNPRNYYNWSSSYVYVPATYFMKLSDSIGDIPINPDTPKEPETPTEPDIPTDPETPIDPETPTDPGTPIDPEIPIEPETPPAKAISAIVEEANYKYGEGNIYGITPGTSIETLKNNLSNTGGVITVTDANGNTKENGNIGTGDKVNITSGVTETLNVLIYGDIDGNGEIDVLDLVALKQHLLGVAPCTGVYLQAANVDTEGIVDVIDLVAIKQYLLNK